MKTINIYFLGFIFCLVSGQLFGQKHSIEYVIGIQSYTDIFITDLTIRQNEQTLGPKIGVNYYLPVSSKLGIQTGFHSSNLRSKAQKTAAPRFGDQFDPITGTFIIDLDDIPTERQTFYSHWYFEIPMNIRININQNKLRIFLETGLSAELYWKSKSKTVTNLYTTSSKFERLPHSHRMQLLANLSIGFLYPVNDKFSIMAKPFSKISLLSDRVSSLKKYRISYGLQLGLSHTF